MKRLNTVWLFLMVLCYSMSQAQNHSFTYPSPVCKTDPNPVPVTSSNFVSGGHFVSSSGITFVNAQTGVVNLLLSSPGTYTVTYTGAICGCFTNAPVTATITILSSPTITVAGNSSVCIGSAISLTASGASSYMWSSGANSAVMSNTPLVNTVYTVIGTAANGCTASATKTITVVAVPNVSISANPTVCLGYNFVMTASAGGPATYTWTGPGLLNSFSPTVTVNPTVSTTYTVVASAAGCTNNAFHSVSVIPIPTVSIIGSNTICAGSRATLYATGAVTYSWNTGSQADSLSIQPTQTTTYAVMGTDFNGCSSTASIMVSIVPKPTVAISGPSVVCSGKTITLTALGAFTYTWNNSIASSTTALYANADTVVSVIGRNPQGCTNTSSLLVKVSPSPTVSVLSTSICAGQQATLIAEPPASQTDPITYVWFPGSASGQTFTPSPAFTTQYTVNASIGSCITREVASVIVKPAIQPVLTFSYVAPHCNGAPPLMPVYPSNFTKGGTFLSPNGTVKVDPTTGAVDLKGTEQGFYTVQYTVAPSGCTVGALSNTFLQVFKSIKIEMPGYVEAQAGDIIILNNSGGASSYIWEPSKGLNCTSCQSPALTVTQSQQYCVSSTQACVEGSCIQVELICMRTGDFSVPTAFTPNGDGKNDKYCLMGWEECNNAFNIKIFDRWGEMVFESNSPTFCWDGIFNGNPLPSGVYVYRIDAQFSKDPSIIKSGNISIIR